MKAFMTCLAAVTWIGLVIWVMDAESRELRRRRDTRDAVNRELMESLSGTH